MNIIDLPCTVQGTVMTQKFIRYDFYPSGEAVLPTAALSNMVATSFKWLLNFNFRFIEIKLY